jgi:ATP-dependent protease HslVU (ClpYQ) peptidase subunit
MKLTRMTSEELNTLNLQELISKILEESEERLIKDFLQESCWAYSVANEAIILIYESGSILVIDAYGDQLEFDGDVGIILESKDAIAKAFSAEIASRYLELKQLKQEADEQRSIAARNAQELREYERLKQIFG